METEELIKADDFCTHYSIEYDLIQSLQESGIIEVVSVQETQYLHSGQLRLLERAIRLHYELGINLEGIEAITSMLERMESLQDEIRYLKNRLRIYEGDRY